MNAAKYSLSNEKLSDENIEANVNDLLQRMTLAEKIGQLNQQNASGDNCPDYLREELRAGRIGSVLNQVNFELVNELQRISIEESRLGIPLLIGRDVIHGFKTIMPIPLGQAASFNPDIVRQGAAISAREASKTGVNWTFAPMVDISRDARWGRIAESLGEDPYLCSILGVAMVEGFQGDDLSSPYSIAACGKHFVGYGASESGRDYNTTNIPENELRNIYLKPFKAIVDAGVSTLMTSFSDLNGVPASANSFILKQVLRDEWKFDGLVVSDWNSIRELSVHGLTENDKQAAFEASSAGVDMEMAGCAYTDHLPELIDEGKVSINKIDTMVANILRAKFRLGLFDNAYTNPDKLPELANQEALQVAKSAALESVVMLKNEHSILPLSSTALSSIAVIGPLANDKHEQLGTWIFDADKDLTITGLQGINDLVGAELDVRYVAAMKTSRTHSTEQFDEALSIASDADVTVLFLGEESILSGEARSRADIDLPGAQIELVRKIREIGKPVVAVILAGRPLTLGNIIEHVDAILYAWHPGTMGGPAIADLLFGIQSPSGKLPVTFPHKVGQLPIYYNHKHTGRPPTQEEVVYIDDIQQYAEHTSLGMTSFHIDANFKPLFPFGYGLSYANFEYHNIHLSAFELNFGDTLKVSAEVFNNSDIDAVEIVQLYIRDLVGSVTRPVKELKGFTRQSLKAGERKRVQFELHTDDLAFHGRDMKLKAESGLFHIWVGGNSDSGLSSEFRLNE
jgi:beta-glucosidase